MAQYMIAGVLDTRPIGSKHGIKHKCQAPGCHKTSEIWVCLNEVEHKPAMPMRFRSVKVTGGQMVVGTCCCKKLLGTGFFPIFHEHAVLSALDEAPEGISSRKGVHLFNEFR